MNPGITSKVRNCKYCMTAHALGSELRHIFQLILTFLNVLLLASLLELFDQTESQLVESVDRDLRKMLIKTNAADPLVLGVRVWPQAIPQFLVGHLDVLDNARTALSNAGFKGLFLGGNYSSGVALGRCVEGAYEDAAKVTDYLSQNVCR